MQMKFVVILFLYSHSLFALKPLEKRACPESFKVSVIIPCHHLHFSFLEPLIFLLQGQLDQADEVVISLSGVEQIPEAQIQKFERRSWPFVCKLIKIQGSKSASENRNIASLHSTGDLLICQDADDLPHLQRFKIIRFLFEQYQIDFLLHQFEMQSIDRRPISFPLAVSKCFAFEEWEEHKTLYYVHHGCPAFLRPVWEAVKWEPSPVEDYFFNQKAALLFPKKALLFLPLIAYRPQHSANR
jgi:hypothetical protein